MAVQTLVVIDDEAQIRRVVRNAFADAGIEVHEAATGRAGVDLVAARRPDLVMLDLGLPDMPGLEVLREVRGWSSVPVLVLSAQHSETEKVALLDAGADDYVTKPFGSAELQARARALLRRGARAPDGATALAVGDLAMDLAARTLIKGGVDVHLTPTEWDLLRELMTHPGRVLTHQHLFRAAWSGRQYGDAQQYLRVYIAQLRRKIEDDPVRPRFIMTEPGVGYRFSADA